MLPDARIATVNTTQSRLLALRLIRSVLMDSLMGMRKWVSDSRESAWLVNPCELPITIPALNPKCEFAQVLYPKTYRSEP